jgi:alkanesulfonate monooxygenase SsuD/methylene tetrahydromethanopterin reductase-like flavin-dependent oxidoreductase (luciferase family)
MRLCLMIEGQEDVSWEQWLALADACERGGLEGLFRSDHYLSVFGREERTSLDAWATLAALAARTERIRLGTLVSPVTFRHPSVLAKNVVTVDHVSGGRVELGLGAGWNEQEHAAFGLPFPDVATRMELLQEQLEVITRQWVERNPSPVQKPRPPLILGGHAGRRSLGLAVRFADEYNIIFVTPEECRGVRGRLDAACEQAGREPLRLSLMTACVVGADRAELLDRVRQRLEVTGDDADPEAYLRERAAGTLAGLADEVVEQLHVYEEAGVERVFLQHLAHEDVEMVALLGAEVVPSMT